MGWQRPYVMLVRLNVTMELSNVSKKREPLNVTKVQSYVIFALPNVMMEQSNMRKKLVYLRSDVGTAQG